MNSFKKASLYFILLILFEFIFLTPGLPNNQRMPAPKKNEGLLPSLSLIGVVVSKNPSSSLAILKNVQTGNTKIVRTGESILGMRLVQVYNNRIILQKNERAFQIFLGMGKLSSIEEKLPKKPEADNTAEQIENLPVENQLNKNAITKEFNRAEVERRIEAEWALIMREIRFVPNLVKGKVSGFKITKLPAKSILSEIGIHKNDIIKEINGIELNDVQKLFSLYDKFKDDNQFKVSVERKGKLIQLSYILK